MPTTERRELTDRERRRAAAFKRAWAAKKARERISQSDAGDALDMSPSAFGQYINGKIPAGMKATLALCHYLGVSYEEAEVTEDFGSALGPGSYRPQPQPPNDSDADWSSKSVAEMREEMYAFAEAMPHEVVKAFLSDVLEILSPKDRLDVLAGALRNLRDDVS